MGEEGYGKDLSEFIYSTNVNWLPTLCQALFEATQWQNRQKPCPVVWAIILAEGDT